MAEKVIELSVEETNKLRADLGLKPLRTSADNPLIPCVTAAGNNKSNTNTNGSAGTDEELELSVNETNKLREKLGLPPLRNGSDRKKKEIYKPPENTLEKEEAAKRIERARLQREVEQGASNVFGSSTLASDGDDAPDSWAAKMRKQKKTAAGSKKDKKNRKAPSASPSLTVKTEHGEYGENDLKGLQVAHNMAELEAGSNTVLTLADAPILETCTLVASKAVGLNEKEDALENVSLTEHEKQRDGLRKKRMLEMGMGRAGGYVGFDDEEFEELGGTLGPSRRERGSDGPILSADGEELNSTERGFRIGLHKDGSKNDRMTDFDKIQHGKAISLHGSTDVAANDYMTIEEEEAEREKKKRKKDSKFKKKKKNKERRRRRTEVDDDDDKDKEASSKIASNLLSELEETAATTESSGLRKRQRDDEDEDGDNANSVVEKNATRTGMVTDAGDNLQTSKRSQYDKAMEKGNQRTQNAFNSLSQQKPPESPDVEEELDDSFLNAAISKARRLNRLRGMNKLSTSGADAVAEAVKSTTAKENTQTNTASSSKISFSIDDTGEFSRALRARTQQKEREALNKANSAVVGSGQEGAPKNDATDMTSKTNTGGTTAEDVEMEDVDMEELAKEVTTEDKPPSGFEGSTAVDVGVGRGLSSFVSMLKTTGEITGKHGGKEELRGRAKDERNYDNYEPLDLSKVVAIGRNATDKDREFANREIKLEYRDKHGRLLTQKEAYRDLCYQFHGHGASKKNEEKRQQQIAREQAEARVASRQVSAARDGNTASTLGALKATQKATGKAFIVHKT